MLLLFVNIFKYRLYTCYNRYIIDILLVYAKYNIKYIKYIIISIIIRNNIINIYIHLQSFFPYIYHNIIYIYNHDL